MIKAIPYTKLWGGIVLLVLIGGTFAAGTGYLLYQDFLFANYAKPTQALVERKHIVVSHSRRGGTSHTPHLTYRYQAGNVVTDTDTSVLESTYDQVSVGQNVPVLYVTSDVSDNRIDLPAENSKICYLSWGLAAATLVVFGVGIALIHYYRKQNRLYSWLKTSGVPSTGLVTAKILKLVGKQKKERYLLAFMFRSPQGEEIIGQSWMIPPKDESRWKEGDPIRVYADPANARRFTVDLKPPGT